MSWIERIKDQLIITTGDGSTYRPKWMNATKSVEYNIAEFEFPEIEGSFVQKRKAKGARYDLLLFFDGEDHLDISQAFERSSRNESPWIIQHPYYGSLTVHPVSLRIDNTRHNVSEITTTVIETIPESNPRTSVFPGDLVIINQRQIEETSLQVFTAGFTPESLSEQRALIDSIYTKGNPFAIEEYFNVYTQARVSLDNALSDAEGTIGFINTFLNAPALFAVNSQRRVEILKDQFNSLKATLGNMSSVSDKQLYQNFGINILSGVAVSATTPIENDYRNRDDVVRMIEDVLALYSLFLGDLDELQSANGGGPERFIPDQSLCLLLNQIINNALSALFEIALGARQQRTLIVEKDTNIILLTHRLYGLDPFDNNINELFENNKWGLKQIFLIRKNTPVVYYI